MSIQYTAIGDSLTTGFGALPGNGFVPVYRRMAEARLRVPIELSNLGVNGLTTDGLEQRLKRDYNYRLAISEAELITMSIGGNDLIKAAKAAGGRPGDLAPVLQKALRECKRNLHDIMGTLSQLKAGMRRPYIIRIVGLYNPYPQLTEATDWVRQFNHYAAGYSSPVCRFASIYNEFAGNERGLLSIDHLHPNGRGYRVIAGKLDTLGYGRLG
ncbi:lysophospholipase [Paenibacillus sp. FSL H7-0357]|uniref:GDSL-type esterase/lipase family protein n=1 Tax=Paenibacillus sp. FSL H7-0357 TaxID=1536774 RepID=UPI0004F7FDE6|nr:GDSL-type esterase/lipase family protein [Paenibacillus sp. FSL H7-0357]AIQ15427.1 lysophospholipase [Paenibacillus sp. FSL H7-0357]